MNFLGIGPGEIFLILILLLVVVGPERLPEFARGAGRMVVRVRNWIARSPDAQLVLRAREELELELSELRRSLAEEVETVRKELDTVRGDLAEATRMVEESAGEVARTRIELDEIAETVEEAAEVVSRTSDELGELAETVDEVVQTIAPPDAPTIAADALGDTLTPMLAEHDAVVDPGLIGSRQRAIAEHKAAEAVEATPVNGQPVPRSFKPGQQPPLRPPAPATASQSPDDAAIAALNERIEALSTDFSQQIQLLSAELQALRERRDEQGVLAVQTFAPEAPVAGVVALDGEHVANGVGPAGENRPSGADTAVDSRRRCKGVTRSGEPCGAPPLKGQDYCRVHAGQRVLEEVSS